MPHEDTKLVDYLVELTTTSWKCDNGTFKSGYGKHLKKMLHEKIPGCDLKEPPTPGVPAAPGASAAPSSSTAPSASYIERNKKKEGAKVLIKNTAVLVDMVSCFKHEKEGAERRMKLMTLLRDAPGLSGDDRMTAGLSILRDNSLIDMVFQLQPGELLLFLKKLL
ncbi:hypothetical protein Ahy_B02g060736 [Arachis hypogaea]|uniref:Uncharacterized protein n=1 Tax=Arachis hypogaea TaxID=3818 RepID=A0A445AJA4_ARAHY|nr:hypothetical protein Ahy_B02g060736 [Arachis hypogaea]